MRERNLWEAFGPGRLQHDRNSLEIRYVPVKYQFFELCCLGEVEWGRQASCTWVHMLVRCGPAQQIKEAHLNGYSIYAEIPGFQNTSMPS